MTQDRRITHKLPGHPLQWDDSASPSAAPAAGQAGLANESPTYADLLAEDLEKIAETWTGCMYDAPGEMIDIGADLRAAFAKLNLAAPVAADTEQATDERAAFEAWVKSRVGYPFAGTFTNLMWDAWQARATLGAPTGKVKETPESMANSNTRFAIDGAIPFGRQGVNRPPSEDHWLHEYWMIGQQLAKLGETSAWDNVTPLATPADAGVGQKPELNLPEPAGKIDFVDEFGRLSHKPGFTREQVDDIIARLSTSGAQVTASDDDDHPALVKALDDIFTSSGWLKYREDKEIKFYPEELRAIFKAGLEAGQSPAPVTAEPARTVKPWTERMGVSINDMVWPHEAWPHVKAEVLELRAAVANLTHPAPADRDALAKAIHAAAVKRGIIHADTDVTGPQLLMLCDDMAKEADRDAIRNEALEEVARQLETGHLEYRLGHECAVTIRALKSMERAADAAETRDAKGGEHAD